MSACWTTPTCLPTAPAPLPDTRARKQPVAEQHAPLAAQGVKPAPQGSVPERETGTNMQQEPRKLWEGREVSGEPPSTSQLLQGPLGGIQHCGFRHRSGSAATREP